jgi:hypothetical protein
MFASNGEASTLRCAGIAKKRTLPSPGLEERDDEPVHLRIGDPAAHPLHQTMMADVVEASLDVSLDDPLIREPWFLTLLVRLGTVATEDVPTPVNRLARSKAIRNRIEVRPRIAGALTAA